MWRFGQLPHIVRMRNLPLCHVGTNFSTRTTICHISYEHKHPEDSYLSVCVVTLRVGFCFSSEAQRTKGHKAEFSSAKFYWNVREETIYTEIDMPEIELLGIMCKQIELVLVCNKINWMSMRSLWAQGVMRMNFSEIKKYFTTPSIQRKYWQMFSFLFNFIWPDRCFAPDCFKLGKKLTTLSRWHQQIRTCRGQNSSGYHRVVLEEEQTECWSILCVCVCV